MSEDDIEILTGDIRRRDDLIADLRAEQLRLLSALAASDARATGWATRLSVAESEIAALRAERGALRRRLALAERVVEAARHHQLAIAATVLGRPPETELSWVEADRALTEALSALDAAKEEK